MEKTWIWFGKNDIISLSDLKQIGVAGLVTSLHHIPNGEIWPIEEILDLKQHIENAGLHWSVVESLPVSESIKFAGPDRNQLIENYKTSLANLGKCGIRTVCYNFMPVIDWIRTDLRRRQANGAYTLYFDKARFAYFDIYILNRENAAADYPDEIIREGEQHPVAIFKRLLANYKRIDKQQLRENLKYFLEQVIPVAEEYNVNLCIHNDVPALARKFASRTHFVHLRSTDVLPNGDFVEASHLAGRANLPELIRIFKLYPNVPMRVDLGQLMLSDIDKEYNPGYSFLGKDVRFCRSLRHDGSFR